VEDGDPRILRLRAREELSEEGRAVFEVGELDGRLRRMWNGRIRDLGEWE